MAAGKNGLALFSSVTVAHKTKITDIKMKKTGNSNYKTIKHLTTLTEETQRPADKHSTAVQSERQHNEVSK